LIEGIRDDLVARSAVDVVSYHSYGVDAQTPENVPNTVLSRLRAKVDADLGAETELWMTETSGFNNGLLDSGDRRGALRMAEGLHTSLVYGDVAAWVHLGGGELLHYGRLSWPGHILRHYARFVRPGALRFDAAPERLADRVLVSAFENPASSDQGPSIAVVLINTDDVPHGLDLSSLPNLEGRTTYREYRSSIHHAGEDMGQLTPADTAGQPYVLPPHGVVTLYQGPPIPTL
jgi:glucuronoarabinoxylan endo-1,4-beta-xylanase